MLIFETFNREAKSPLNLHDKFHSLIIYVN